MYSLAPRFRGVRTSPTKSSPSVLRYDLAMVLVSVIWGINFSVSKYALGAFPVFAFTGLRFLGATGLLWSVLRVTEGPATVSRRQLLQLFGLGVLGNTLYQMGFMTGLSLTTATNSSVLIAFIPVLVAVLGGIMGIETPTPAARWALAAGTVGVLMVVLAGGDGTIHFGGPGTRGDLLTLGSVVCWSLFTLGVRQAGEGLSPLRVTTLTTAAGMPGLLLLGLPDLLTMDWLAIPPLAWGALLYASAVSIVVAYLLWNHSVRALGTNRTSLYACVVPVFAAAAAALLLGENLRPLQVAGGVLVVASVLLSRGTGVVFRRVPRGIRS